MKWLGRLGAAFLLSAGLFAASPESAQSNSNTGQDSACPLVTSAKIVSGTSYLMSAADKCQWVVFTNSGSITVQLPAPGLIFPPTWNAKLLVTNGGKIG